MKEQNFAKGINLEFEFMALLRDIKKIDRWEISFAV